MASVASCIVLAIDVGNRAATTIEALAQGDTLRPLQEAFIARDVMQCGYRASDWRSCLLVQHACGKIPSWHLRRRAGEKSAIRSIADVVALDRTADGRCQNASLVLGVAAPTPGRETQIEGPLPGQRLQAADRRHRGVPRRAASGW